MAKDLARPAVFWNRLQGAMFQVGKQFNDKGDGIVEPTTKPPGDWLTALEDYFKERGWPHATGIDWEHLRAIAKAAPEFVIAGSGTTSDPYTLTLAGEPGHKPTKDTLL